MIRPIIPPPGLSGIILGEIIFSLVIILLCFSIYYLTREIYSLTRYKGISYFRKTFLFLGIAYTVRIFLRMMAFPGQQPPVGSYTFFIMPFSFLVIGFFSTLALVYLFLSISKKAIPHKEMIAYTLALAVSIIAILSHEFFLVGLVQMILLLATAITTFSLREKKSSKLFLIYVLLFVFWIFELMPLGSWRLFNPSVHLAVQSISALIFIIIFYKVYKWVK